MFRLTACGLLRSSGSVGAAPGSVICRALRRAAAAAPPSGSRGTPNHSHTHSQQEKISTSGDVCGFSALGLRRPLLEGLAAQGLEEPTLVQSSVIPRLLSGENLVLSASTGTGKTLAYTLPVIHSLLEQEERGYKRQHQRPRCLVLVPTRELATQVLDEVKRLSHFAKVSSCGILGGEAYNIQKKALSGKVDVVVASPGRLVQHEKLKNLNLGEISHVVIDEVDTMLTQGFGADIRYVLQKVFQAQLAKHRYPSRLGVSSGKSVPESKGQTSSTPQLIMASATMTKAVRALLQDVKGFSADLADVMSSKGSNSTSEKVSINIAEITGVHCTVPNVNHRMVDTKGEDKLMVLDGIIQEMHKKVTKTMIFCNTIDSCRAVAYFLDAQTTNNPCLSYHGEINSKDRARNMELFRSDPCGEPMFMVCSDIAARGLDIPGVDHVLMFDFPLNPVDYLHRTGRTGRLGQGGKGIVTAIVAKRDRVLAQAIEGAIARNKPLDSLTSHKRDYQDKGKLAAIVGRRDQEDYYHGKDLERRKDGPRITLKRRSTKRLVSDPNRHGIHVRQPAQKTVSRTVAKRIAEINQRRGEQLVRKRKKDLADKKKKSSKF